MMISAVIKTCFKKLLVPSDIGDVRRIFVSIVLLLDNSYARLFIDFVSIQSMFLNALIMGFLKYRKIPTQQSI